MYFNDRGEAGERLAAELDQYRYENCVVLALSDGGVMVGERIAIRLHCILTLLLTEQIEVPGEDQVFGSVDPDGQFVYNHSFSEDEYEEYYGEFHGYLEDQKRQKMHHINELLGDGGLLDADMLRDHVVILVSDGLSTGVTLEAAAEYLKHIRVTRMVIATPVASVSAVDRMHVLGDEIHVLHVTDNFLDTDHYYDNNVVPSHEETIARINATILNWR